ncbi:MAG: hypothetical protein K9J42_12420 [Sulfuritalea sp.]|nr:hypothetical protein [Sulfuritalea sp.]
MESAAANSTSPAAQRLASFITLAVLLVVIAAGLAYRLTHQTALAELEARGAGRIGYHAGEMAGAIEKFEYLPYLLGLEASLTDLLYSPTNAAHVDAANRYLAFAQSRAGIAAAYLMDTGGTTLAASNWEQPTSFVGRNYDFRPYFQEALAGRTGRFYGVGATTGEPGAFIAAPISVGNDVIGVVAVKIDLAALERDWRQSDERLAVADAHGILFLASDPTWRYRSLHPLPPAVHESLRHTRQYGDISPQPLYRGDGTPPGARAVQLTADGHRYIVQGRPIGRLGWRLLLFSDPSEATERGLLAAAIAGLATALALAGMGLGWQYRRRLTERMAARRELARVAAELEQRIAERTEELTAANDTAVQTGKLAVLGQMAAGISHELSQPLAALRTLADNAAAFLRRGDAATARSNLDHIGELCTRMGSIVGELKAFARKEPARLQAVPIHRVIANVLMLVEPHRRDSATVIDVSPVAEDIAVLADSIRLEQVLVNLVRNGIDAMEDQPRQLLKIDITANDAEVKLAIRDHGPGLSPQAKAHLFEPFFTTKPSGKGLGLGLALSQAIVREMGATLRAHDGEPGAVFEITLPRAASRPPIHHEHTAD